MFAYKRYIQKAVCLCKINDKYLSFIIKKGRRVSALMQTDIGDAVPCKVTEADSRGLMSASVREPRKCKEHPAGCSFYNVYFAKTGSSLIVLASSCCIASASIPVTPSPTL